MKCIIQAWNNHEDELRSFLQGRLGDIHCTDDLLQDVFVKALANRRAFCQLENTKAWLFRVAKNRLIDYQRTCKNHVEVSNQHSVQNDKSAPVANLSKCLPFVLTNLSTEDQEIIKLCDLEGLQQAEYASLKNMTVSGAKSRIQRARKKLKTRLQSGCQVVFNEQGAVCCFRVPERGAVNPAPCLKRRGFWE